MVRVNCYVLMYLIDYFVPDITLIQFSWYIVRKCEVAATLSLSQALNTCSSWTTFSTTVSSLCKFSTCTNCPRIFVH